MPRKARSPRLPEEKASDAALGKHLNALRKERGFTQVQPAEKVGVVQPIISDYERGRLRPHTDMLVRLASALDISSDELLGIATAPKPPPRSIAASCAASRPWTSVPERDQEALLRTIDAFLSKSA